MREWSWLTREVVFAVHDAQLAEHSGQSGVRDIALLDTILARPAQLAASGDATAAHLAASYGYGIALERPFLLGNERTAFVALELFLQLNSQRLTADNAHCVLMMRDVAAGHISEEHFADWVAEHLAPLDAAWEKSKI
jgi:death on curing protein